MPTFAVFDEMQVMDAMTNIDQYQKIELHGSYFQDCENETQVLDRIQDLVPVSCGHLKYWMGTDLGFSQDPSEILLFEESEDEVLKLILRIHAKRVPYPVVSEIISFIDKIYSPSGIGTDRGSNGISVEQDLLNLDKFK
nr:hypothetical protein [Bacteroidota bacterium]